jgi:hypothetical protein
MGTPLAAGQPLLLSIPADEYRPAVSRPGLFLGMIWEPVEDSSNFDSNSLKFMDIETISARATCPRVIQLPRAPGPMMQNQFTHEGEEQLDRTTSAAICSAIGERLRRDMGPDDNSLPSHLQTLLDQMQQQDDQNTGNR